MRIRPENFNKVFKHATETPWKLYGRTSYLQGFSEGYYLTHIGSGYYFVDQRIFFDYIEDIKNPQEHEKEYLKLFMSELAWYYWFDVERFIKLSRKQKVNSHAISRKGLYRRFKILISEGWNHETFNQ